MTLNIFLILTAYLMAKVVREPMILAGGGAELKSYSSVFQTVLLLGAVQLFGWLATHLSRRKLINSVTLFFIAGFLLFYFGLITIGPWNGIGYYLFVGIFSLMIIAQFWSFANDIYTTEQGKRLFVLLAFGASAGGVFGPMLAGRILDLVGVYNLLPISAGVLAMSLILTNYIMSTVEQTPNSGAIGPKPTTRTDMGKEGALKIVFQSRYLLLIAFLMLCSNFVNTTGEYMLGRSVSETAAALAAVPGAEAGLERSYIAKFYADFFTLVGFVGLLLQLFVVSRVLKYLGVKFAIMTLPVIALGTNAIIALFPLLAVIRSGKIAENATDYSLNNTVRQILFLPCTKEQKYKAKVAIDSFFVRAGDVCSAGLVFAGATWLNFSLRYFAVVNLLLAAACVVLALAIGREFRRRTEATSAADHPEPAESSGKSDMKE